MARTDVPNAAIWKALRDWVDSREALERANGVSAITPSQAEIITRLMTVEENLTTDGRNYVAELNLYSQQNHSGPVDYSSDQHIPPGPGGGGGRWRISCKLSWCDQTFPQPGYGFSKGQEVPSFPSKKTAKQFAAKTALEYISQEAASLALTIAMSTNTISLGPRKAPGGSDSHPPLKKARTESSKADGGVSLAPLGTMFDRIKESGTTEGGVPARSGSGIQDLVPFMAQRLNYQCPTYIVTPEPGRQGFFSGEAVWRREPLAPEQPIRVHGVLGKTQATEQLATKVLEWLSRQGEKRDADLAAILADISPVQSN